MTVDVREQSDQIIYHEHVSDIFRDVQIMMADGVRPAIAFITNTEGGAVRSVGAAMAIGEDQRTYGYVSGGCIDADVRLQAIDAIQTNRVKQLRYGKGSPFVDLPLPCGGAKKKI